MPSSTDMLLTADGLKRSVDNALERLAKDVPAADQNTAKFHFSQTGAKVEIYSRFRIKEVDGRVGAEVGITWKGKITPEGYVELTW